MSDVSRGLGCSRGNQTELFAGDHWGEDWELLLYFIKPQELMIKAAAPVLRVPIRIFFAIILSTGKIKKWPSPSAPSAGFMQCECVGLGWPWSHGVGACPRGNLGKGLHGFLG